MSTLDKQRHGGAFGAGLHAEWTKFRTVRGWPFGLLLAMLLMVLFSYLQAHGKHTGYCTSPNPNSCVNGHPYVPNGPSGEAVADAYELVAKRLTGNGTITVRITAMSGRIAAGPANQAPSVGDTRPGLAGWAKAGLLVTPSTKQGSAYAAVMATGSHGVRFQYDYTHDQAGLPGPVASASPRWLRLTRSGDTITGYDSSNGTDWRKIESTRLTVLPKTVDIGLFTTSPTTLSGSSTQATAAFDHVTIGPLAAGASRPPRDRGRAAASAPARETSTRHSATAATAGQAPR